MIKNLICLSLFIPTLAFAIAVDNSLAAIASRIEPVGKVNLEKESLASTKIVLSNKISKVNQIKPIIAEANNGQEIYTKNCSACHDSGAAGAPKLVAKAWQARAKQGLVTLVDHAIKGYKTMPLKGGCVQCTDADIKQAVLYILKQARVKS